MHFLDLYERAAAEVTAALSAKSKIRVKSEEAEYVICQ